MSTYLEQLLYSGFWNFHTRHLLWVQLPRKGVSIFSSSAASPTALLMLSRDIYYRDPELFIKQTVVDRYVDDIAYTLGVERDALNVVRFKLPLSSPQA